MLNFLDHIEINDKIMLIRLGNSSSLNKVHWQNEWNIKVSFSIQMSNCRCKS